MKVQVERLTKHYGATRALTDVSFAFESGQIVGFIGPNGAGKSTTMRILATLDEPTSGNASIDGHSVLEEPERTRQMIGYVPDSLPSLHDISVHEYLDFFARTYGIRSPKRQQVVAHIEEFTNLGGIRNKHLNALSKGMKNRVSVARALVHDPPILLMDEPAAGLDPRARIELRELLKVLAGQGKAVLISSHILTELAEICNAAVFIERGRILRSGTLDEIMRGDTPHRCIHVRVLERTRELHEHLLLQPNVLAVRTGATGLEADVTGDDRECADLLAALIRDGYPICEFQPRQTDLEQLFLTITRGEVQ